MKGKKTVIDALNVVLCNELTAINQYFLHARMLQNWGLAKLGKLEYEASIDEMKHADQVIKRILFLEGLPNVQKMNKIRIGQTLSEVLNSDLALENDAIPNLRDFVKLAEQETDYISRDLFNSILESEEHHVDWLETQISLMEKIGEANYMQSQIDMENSQH